MESSTAIAIVGAIVGVAGAVTSWRTSRSSAKKDDVEALSIIIRELREDNDALRTEVDRLTLQVETLQKENEQLREDNRHLTCQLSKSINGLRREKLA